jgi:hypothetical protein
VVGGWALIIASILLHSIYQKQSVSPFDFVLLFLASVFAGLVLVDIRTILFGYLVAFVIAVAFVYICLVLPAILSVFTYGEFGEVVYREAARLVFLAVFPFSFFLCFVGGFVGGALGEWFGIG